MAVGIVDRQKLVNIADAVRAKKGITGEMTLDAIASNIASIPTVDNNAKFDFSGSGSKSSGKPLFYLTKIDLSGWDTSNVTDMNYMFSGCSSLTSLDLSNFNTSKVTNMGSMFNDCSSLTSLDLSNWNTSNVTNMSSMFKGCSSIETLDLSNFDFSNMSSGDYSGINSLVYDCMNLKTIIFPSTVSFKNTGIGLSSVFFMCSSLTSLDLSGFNTTNVNKMNYLFYGCSSLTSLDLSNFNTSKVTNMGSMFSDCSSLTSLDLSNWNTSNVTNMGNMFYNCSSLTSLDLSGFDTSKVTGMSSIFTFCSKLSNLTLGTDWASNSGIDSFNLSYCPLTHESAVDVINKLATRNNSPVITFRSKVGLYQSEIDVATNKGWSVSGCSVLVDAETATVGQYTLIDGEIAKCIYVADTPQAWGQRIFSGQMLYVGDVYMHQWGGYGTATGITATAIGTGLTNTNALLAMNLQSTDGTPTIWDAIKEFRNTHSDRWFIASRDEGVEAKKNGLDDIWTSSEYDANQAYRTLDNSSKYTWVSKTSGNRAFAFTYV